MRNGPPEGALGRAGRAWPGAAVLGAEARPLKAFGSFWCFRSSAITITITISITISITITITISITITTTIAITTTTTAAAAPTTTNYSCYYYYYYYYCYSTTSSLGRQVEMSSFGFRFLKGSFMDFGDIKYLLVKRLFGSRVV